jgi:type III protein arginine methyltransferase
MDDIAARFPGLAGNPLGQAMFCRLLRDRGRDDDALALGLAATAAAPDDPEVRDLARAALSAGVPAWHVPMLHDAPRNRAYAAAIARLVRPGMLVFEIGSGGGLLSLLAARAGAEVVTCEADPIVAAAAAESFRRNGLADHITLLRKTSTDVVPGDLPRPADLLMSELFDDSLFGDGILEYLDDARRRLLAPGAPVLPGRSALRCALVAMPPHPPSQPLDLVEGFDLSAMNVLLRPSASRPVRRADATRRSAPVSALAMDYDAPAFGATRERIALVSDGGRVDGVAQWLHIDFGDGVTFENDPFAGDSHWASRFHAFGRPIDTTPGERVAVDVRLVRRQLVMKPAG